MTQQPLQPLSQETPYENLSPETVMTAVEALCGRCTGAIFALNSYENRVYDVTLDDGRHVIAKFYRPYRWPKAAILEEHAFTNELAALEIPVVAPLAFDGETLFEHADYLYALYPKRGGRPFEVRGDDDLRMMGRLLGRLHNVGAQAQFEHRPALSVKAFGWDNLVYLRQAGVIPADLLSAYDATATQLLHQLDEIWAGRTYGLRLHGDCHLGNILFDKEPFLVDLDDCLSGPAVQDMWMLVSGDREELSHQMGTLLEGYQQLRDFDYSELRLVEVLRSLRMMNYAAWLARRWNDPTFPKNFPFFATQQFWENHVLSLKEQLSVLAEPILVAV